MKTTIDIKRQHGGDLDTFRERYGRAPLDYSSNVSPLGVPEEIKQAIAEAAAEVDRYPDPLCRALTEKIAQEEGVPAEWVLCGAGAADVIFRAVAAINPANTLLPVPSFSEYEHALEQVPGRVDYFPSMEWNGFRLDQTFLDRIDDSVDLVMLCEPNNPTGVLDHKQYLNRVLEACEQHDAWLIVDESFLDMTENAEEMTMTPQLGEDRKLLIIRSFTKMYAMAGVRLGYCLCGSAKLLAGMREQGPPWGVSHIAQKAGLAAFEAGAYKERVLEMVRTEKPYLYEGLRSLGLYVLPGAANYLFFKGPLKLPELLSEKGILIRDCSNYRGLGGGWYRIAVRTHEENEQLLAAMREVCQ
jgi:threonine-phosphate decarboxylase